MASILDRRLARVRTTAHKLERARADFESAILAAASTPGGSIRVVAAEAGLSKSAIHALVSRQ